MSEMTRERRLTLMWRWAVVSVCAAALFWLVWRLVVGSVPELIAGLGLELIELVTKLDSWLTTELGFPGLAYVFAVGLGLGLISGLVAGLCRVLDNDWLDNWLGEGLIIGWGFGLGAGLVTGMLSYDDDTNGLLEGMGVPLLAGLIYMMVFGLSLPFGLALGAGLVYVLVYVPVYGLRKMLALTTWQRFTRWLLAR